jgi:hypothetical protein
LLTAFQCRGLNLSPSLRVRLHGRSRLPELAVTMSLATVALLFGCSAFAPVSGNDMRTDVENRPMFEMRSAATNETPIPIRRDVRIIPLDHAANHDATNS